MQVYARLCEDTCPCECVCVCVCTFVLNETTNSVSGWALCFDFFSFSLRSNASPISYAARTSLEGLQSLSPSTYESVPPPPSPFLSSLLFLSSPSSPGYLYWHVGLLVCSPITSITDRFFLNLFHKASLENVFYIVYCAEFNFMKATFLNAAQTR